MGTSYVQNQTSDYHPSLHKRQSLVLSAVFPISVRSTFFQFLRPKASARTLTLLLLKPHLQIRGSIFKPMRMCSPPSFHLALPQEPSGTWIITVPSHCALCFSQRTPQSGLSPPAPEILLHWDSCQNLFKYALILLKFKKHWPKLPDKRFPLTLLNYRNSKVTDFYMLIFSKQETQRLQVTPAPNCKPCTFFISKIYLQTCWES